MASRISRSKNSQATKRTAILVAVTLVGILFFVFILLPLSVRLFQIIPRSGNTPGTEQQLPPQRPVLYPLPEFTSESRIEITGFAEAQSLVSLVINGGLVDEVTIGEDGEFTFSNAQLSDGQNRVYVVSENSSNLTSQSTEYLVTFDAVPPELLIESPTDGQEIRSRRDQTVELKGQSEPNVRLTVNERLIFVDSSGQFSGSFQLSEGENILEFVAIDQAGNETRESRRVVYNPD